MFKLLPVLFLLLFCSCNKKTESEFIWEKSFGTGEAVAINETADSGIVACGVSESQPFLVKLDKSFTKIFDFSYPGQGLLTSSSTDYKNGLISSGTSAGKMLLLHIDKHGRMLWDTTLNAGFNLKFSGLIKTGNGNFIALGTSDAESNESTNLFFVKFDTTGHIIDQHFISSPGFVSAQSMVLDNTGNLYLAITRSITGGKPKASVARYNYQYQKLWETDLYNNPGFGASSIDVQKDETGNLYVSGKTELNQEGAVNNNSFLVSLTKDGTIRWKKYLELSNSGISLILDQDERVVMLNKNCLVLNIINTSDGTASGRIRVMEVCDSKDTDAIGLDLCRYHDGNILLSGSKGNSFYIALRSFVY